MGTKLRLVQTLYKSEKGIPYILCDKHYAEDRATTKRQGFDDLVIIRDRKSYLINGDGYYFAPPRAKCCMCR